MYLVSNKTRQQQKRDPSIKKKAKTVSKIYVLEKMLTSDKKTRTVPQKHPGPFASLSATYAVIRHSFFAPVSPVPSTEPPLHVLYGRHVQVLLHVVQAMLGHVRDPQVVVRPYLSTDKRSQHGIRGNQRNSKKRLHRPMLARLHRPMPARTQRRNTQYSINTTRSSFFPKRLSSKKNRKGSGEKEDNKRRFYDCIYEREKQRAKTRQRRAVIP